jgi:hypothetical protein
MDRGQSAEMDERFLEVTHDAAVSLLNEHHERRVSWFVEDVLPTELVAEVVARRKVEPDFLQFPDHLRFAGEVFLLTEDGIVYYPRDVGNILNPKGYRAEDNDPHEGFVRTWTAEERRHSYGGVGAISMMGSNLRTYEADREAFIRSGNVPNPASSLHGIAYVSLQEANTGTPYRLLIEQINSFRKSLEGGDELTNRVFDALVEFYGRTARDEQLHYNFLTGIAKEALFSGDTLLASALMTAMAEQYGAFEMPGQGREAGIPNLARRAVKIRKAGIFSGQVVEKSLRKLLKDRWKIDEVINLTGQGREAQDKLTAFMLGDTIELKEVALL